MTSPPVIVCERCDTHARHWRTIDNQWLCEAWVNADHLRELPNHLNLRRAVPRGDSATEARRSRWRRADAKRRGTYRYAEGGDPN